MFLLAYNAAPSLTRVCVVVACGANRATMGEAWRRMMYEEAAERYCAPLVSAAQRIQALATCAGVHNREARLYPHLADCLMRCAAMPPLFEDMPAAAGHVGRDSPVLPHLDNMDCKHTLIVWLMVRCYTCCHFYIGVRCCWLAALYYCLCTTFCM